MKLPTWRRPYSIPVLLGCVLAFIRCGNETLAGSSVTTGNPTEIQVSFTGENGPTALTGRVEIYGATQVPIPGFRPEPLARIDVAGQQDVLLDAGVIAGIADSLWPAGSLEGDSLARFNLVFMGDGQGAILKDLALRKKAGEFVVEVATTLARKGEKQAASEVKVARLEVGLAALAEYKAFIDPATLTPNSFNYLFLKGTGYAAQAEDGIFRFAALPISEHSVSFMELPDPDRIEGSQERDSAFIYSLNRPITSGTQDTLSISELDFGLTLPDLYKNKK